MTSSEIYREVNVSAFYALLDPMNSQEETVVKIEPTNYYG